MALAQSHSAPLTKPLATYAHARSVGDLLLIAGQGCRDPETNSYAGLTLNADGSIARYDIDAQARGVLHNVERVLKQNGLDRSAIVDVTVFLTSMDDFDKMNAVWNEFFKETPPPARTTVCVKELPGKNFIEMKAIASSRRS